MPSNNSTNVNGPPSASDASCPHDAGGLPAIEDSQNPGLLSASSGQSHYNGSLQGQRNAYHYEFHIVNMAISDLLVPVFAMPRAIVEIHFGILRWLVEGTLGLALCKVTSFLQDISTAVSVQSLVLISFDRFHAVSKPLKVAMAKTKVKKAIPFIWFIAALTHACYLYGFQLHSSINGKVHCVISGWSPLFTKLLFIFLMFAVYIVPLCINTTLYTLIVTRLRDQRVYGTPSAPFNRQRVRQNRAVLKMSVAIVVVFFLSMTPFVIYLSLELFGKNKGCSSADFRFYSQYLVHCRGILNFFTYVFFNQRYRSGFRKILEQCLSPCARFTSPNRKTYEVNSPTGSSTAYHVSFGTVNKGFTVESQTVELLHVTQLESQGKLPRSMR